MDDTAKEPVPAILIFWDPVEQQARPIVDHEQIKNTTMAIAVLDMAKAHVEFHRNLQRMEHVASRQAEEAVRQKLHLR